MSLRTAVYARYSSDRQSPASIQDQLRKCREFAEERQWDFQDLHVYTDEALSGAGADRPGLVRLLAAAGRLPRPFDVVLLDDTSRLSRNIGDIARAFEKLSFAGIRTIAVSQAQLPAQIRIFGAFFEVLHKNFWCVIKELSWAV